MAPLGRLMALLVVTACAAPPPPHPAAPPVPSSAPPPAEAEPPVRESAADPSVVRCGIDDRPRAILGERDGASGDASRAKRRMDFSPPPPQVPLAVPLGSAAVPPPTLPRASAKLAPPRLAGGGAAPTALTTAFDASSIDLDGCEALATPEDEGSFELSLSLASGGAPLVVSALAAGKPTVYVRCVMERACRLRGDEAAMAGAVIVPIAVRWNFPKARGKPPTQTGAQAPRAFFEARDDANASKHGFYRALRVLVRQDARACSGPVDGAEMRITLGLSKGKAPRVASVKVEPLAPGIADGVAECITERSKNRQLPERPAGSAEREVALIVAW